MEVGHHNSNFALAAHGFDAIELRPQCSESSGVSLFLIHASRPVLADLLLDRGALRRWFGGDLEHRLVDECLVPQLELPKGSPEYFVRGHGIVSDPAVARVPIKIGAGIDRSIYLLRIEVIKLDCFAGVLRWGGLSE